MDSTRHQILYACVFYNRRNTLINVNVLAEREGGEGEEGEGERTYPFCVSKALWQSSTHGNKSQHKQSEVISCTVATIIEN